MINHMLWNLYMAFGLILHVHASVCVISADICKLRQQSLIYILIDTEQYLLICKTSGYNYIVYIQLSECLITSLVFK